MVETMESAERNCEARFVSATAKCDAGCIRVTFSWLGGDLHKPETYVPLSVKRHSIMGTLASLVHALQCQRLFLLLFGCLPVHFSRLHPWVHDNMIRGNSLCKSLHLFFQSSGSCITPQNRSAQNMTKHDCVSLLRCGSPTGCCRVAVMIFGCDSST